MLNLLSPDDAARLRDFLAETGYTQGDLRDRLLRKESALRRGRNLPRLLDQTREPTALHTLLRWFLLGVPVDAAAARGLLPAWLPGLCVEHGLLAREGDALYPLVMLTPFEQRLFASDPYARIESPESSDIVLWPNPTTRLLYHFTIRRPFGTFLDLGTGCGVQAIGAAAHCGRAIATDLNPRATAYTAFNARLNGLDNVECLAGDTFEPVKDRRFDLIATNPPFFVSPSTSHVFCDSNMELDQYCRRVVREGSRQLNEGGFLQLMLEWVEVRGQAWQDRLAEWLEGSGCDAWIWRAGGRDADQYAQDRIAETSTGTFDEWMAYYREKSVQAIHGGVLAMRRRSGKNWLRFAEMPADPPAAFGDAVWHTFAARDFLDAHASDTALLEARPRLSPEAQLEQKFRREDGEWKLFSLRLSLTRGIPVTMALDPLVAAFVSSCDGRRTLAELLQDLSANVDATSGQVQVECLKIARTLIERGLLLW